MKHLVVDARAAMRQVDGLGTYLKQIVPTICAAGHSAGDFRTTLLVSPEIESFWREAAPGAVVLPSTVGAMRPQQNWQIPRLLAPLAPDLYFYPAHDPPAFLRAPLIFTIHDVTLFQLRPYFERFDRAKLGYLRLVTPRGLRRARAVLAVSKTTKQEIGAIFGASLLSKIHVTANGMSPPPAGAAAARAAAPSDRILYVGTDRPHKNLRRVIQAYTRARRTIPTIPRLEIVGGMRSPRQLRELIAAEGVEGRVILRGHVSEVELEECYTHALALVVPSLAEGFGLPILEAMARGVPVITSSVSACAEVAGNAALTVDPLDVDAIASAVVRMVSDVDLRADLARRGRPRAAEFTWERTAEQTLSGIRDCLAHRSAG